MAFLKDFLKKIKPNEKSKKNYSYLNQCDPMEIWEIVGEIGDGAFGKVYKAKNKENETIAALKQVELEEEGYLEEYIVEIEILTECKHPNIINLFAAYNFSGKLWMSLEFCNGGALDSLMLDLDKNLSESAIKYVSKEVLSGLVFLHDHHVIHRDMKAGNILVTKDADVKLADFGISAKMSADKNKRNSFQGTPYWMAPEVISCQNMEVYYDCRADIWSLGITLIELAQMRPPYHQMQPNRVLLKITKAEPPVLDRPNLWTSNFKLFLKQCLVKDAESRPYASELINSKFIQSVSNTNKRDLKVLIYEAKAENIEETVEDVDINNVEKTVFQNGGMDEVARKIYLENDDASSMSSIEMQSLGKSEIKEQVSNEILCDIIDAQIKSEKDKLSLFGVVYDIMNEINPQTNIDDTVKQIDQQKKVVRQDSLRMAMEEVPIEVVDIDINEKPIEKIQDQIPNKEGDKEEQDKENDQNKIDRKKSHYRTMTRKKVFEVDGEQIVRVDKKVVREGLERKNVEEINYRKEMLREMRILAKLESRQKRQLDFKIELEKNDLINKLKYEESMMEKSYENDLDKLLKEHKLKLEKMESVQFNKMKELQKELLIEKEKKEADFKKKDKEEFKTIMRDLPKSQRNENLKRLKDNNNVTFQSKLRKYSSDLLTEVNEKLDKEINENRKKIYKEEKNMLEEKFKRKKKFDDEMTKKEINDLNSRMQLEKHHNSEAFMLRRQQIKNRQEKEKELLEKDNKKELDELDTIQINEKRNIPRIIKTVSRTRYLQKKAELEILREKQQITQGDFRKLLKDFTETEKEREKKDLYRKEQKLVRIRDDLLKDHALRQRENDQIHAEQKKELMDREDMAIKVLKERFDEEKKIIDEKSQTRKVTTQKMYEEEVNRVNSFYNESEGSNGIIAQYTESTAIQNNSIGVNIYSNPK